MIGSANGTSPVKRFYVRVDQTGHLNNFREHPSVSARDHNPLCPRRLPPLITSCTLSSLSEERQEFGQMNGNGDI